MGLSRVVSHGWGALALDGEMESHHDHHCPVSGRVSKWTPFFFSLRVFSSTSSYHLLERKFICIDQLTS